MKYIHFQSSGMLAALAAALESCNFNTEDYQIALGMNAPWLFLNKGDCFVAGQGLYTAEYMNYYLLPNGYHLEVDALTKETIPAYLRLHKPVILPLHLDSSTRHPVVFTGYQDGRYSFTNVITDCSAEPAQLSLSRQMLARRLDEKCNVLTLKQCTPFEPDPIPLLLQSFHALQDYEAVIMNICRQTITRTDLKAMHKSIFKPFFVDLLPMAQLLQEPVLCEELRLLNHDYRHIFTINSPEQVALYERLPRSSIRKCIAWMKENIVDRIYMQGLTDEEVEALLAHVEHNR